MRAFLKSILGKSALLFTSRIISKLGTIATVVIIARYLHADMFGRYSSIAALTIFAGLIGDFGLVIPTIRSLSAQIEKGNELVGKTLSARVLWSGFSLVIVLCLGMALHFPPLLTILFALGSIFEAFMTGLVRTFEAIQDMRTVTKLNILERFVYFVTVTASVLLFGTLHALAAGICLSYCVMTAIVMHLFQRQFGKLHLRLDLSELWSSTKIGLPFLAIALASALYYKVDTLFLSWYSSASDVGIYNAAVRIVEAQMFIPMAVMATVFPSLAKAFSEGDPELLRNLRYTLTVFGLMGLILAATMFAAAPFLIRVLFSTSYIQSVAVLQILSLMLFFYFMYFAIGYCLMAFHREIMFTIGMMTVCATTILGDYYVIPKYGYIGASWVRVSAEGLMALILGIFLWIECTKVRLRSPRSAEVIDEEKNSAPGEYLSVVPRSGVSFRAQL